ncbi:MAG: fructose-bisphosphatase, class II [Candidatus Buchananbacteria bacterium RIFCSPHIGHO2_01_FULL_44_11]|uniref:Fructose-1,6-bisphosphatase n=1 Tax=Candidatus Buchananbacteria bacterium RIFCSPHIGHO2_01_FULL_44_11 TaxID=1797535 RepID=A0A1G1Y174_9BACT|nr:MAG: fructose-bisphosphatase, class II [Candidatus Buchananbacteria bacterium RIFCSPHIGHO2_01_FULL_44_11]
MDRNLALEFVRVTEAAAIAAAKWLGRGDGKKADGAAVDEMRDRFNQIDFSGRVVIGEGEKDEAPELYTGEKVGKGNGPEMDLAVDPLEATDSVAFGRLNAISVIAAGAKGSLLHAPDTYMDKIIVGKEAASIVDLDAPVKVNLNKIAQALGKPVEEVTVMILDRPRHEKLIAEIRAAGSRVRLITDGDVAAGIASCLADSGVDVVLGIGGSTEAVLAAVAVKILGGQILCRFKPRHEADQKAVMECLDQAGIKDINTIFKAEDLAKGHQLTFTATGIIDGPLVPGVLFKKDQIITHSIVIRGQSGTVRYITTHHHS